MAQCGGVRLGLREAVLKERIEVGSMRYMSVVDDDTEIARLSSSQPNWRLCSAHKLHHLEAQALSLAEAEIGGITSSPHRQYDQRFRDQPPPGKF